MKGINRTIFERIEPSLRHYRLDNNDINLIKIFLSSDPNHFETRKDLAIEIINRVLSTHNKEEFIEQIINLADIEKHIREIQKHVRDHVVHAVLTFLLGIFLIEELNLHLETKFEWKLCSLLHDIAYPFEIAINLPRKIQEHINELRSKLQVNTPKIAWNWNFFNLERLSGNRSSLEPISDRLNTWELGFNAEQLYADMMNSGKLNHGIISALLVMKLTDMLYKTYNPEFAQEYIDALGSDWNYNNFQTYIVHACASIFIHNLPDSLFEQNALNVERHTLPFLLKLADELQDWERLGMRSRTVYTAEKYDIRIYPNQRRVEFEVPSRKVSKFEKLNLLFDGLDLQVSQKH